MQPSRVHRHQPSHHRASAYTIASTYQGEKVKAIHEKTGPKKPNTENLRIRLYDTRHNNMIMSHAPVTPTQIRKQDPQLSSCSVKETLRSQES
jgi:hypothetical protein